VPRNIFKTKVGHDFTTIKKVENLCFSV